MNTPPPPPETVSRRRQWQNATTPQTMKRPEKESISPVKRHSRSPPEAMQQARSPTMKPQQTKRPQPQPVRRQPEPDSSPMSRQRVNTTPNRSNSSEVPPSPQMGRNRSTPLLNQTRQSNQTSPQRKSSSPLGYPPRKNDWRPTPPVVDLSMVPAPPPAPGGGRPSKRMAAPVKSHSTSSFFGKRKSKRAPKTKQEKPSPADFRKARKKNHFYAQPKLKNGGGGPLRVNFSFAFFYIFAEKL